MSAGDYRFKYKLTFSRMTVVLRVALAFFVSFCYNFKFPTRRRVNIVPLTLACVRCLRAHITTTTASAYSEPPISILFQHRDLLITEIDIGRFGRPSFCLRLASFQTSPAPSHVHAVRRDSLRYVEQCLLRLFRRPITLLSKYLLML